MKHSWRSPLLPLVVTVIGWCAVTSHGIAQARSAAVRTDGDPNPTFVTINTVRVRHDNDHVSVGHDTDLPAGQTANSVVSVGGSSSVEGEATQDVVSVLGNTRVTGSVGHDAVAVLGDTYVDSHVGADAVAVLGNVTLGPHAEVDGDVVAVGGVVRRDPVAIVHGSVQQVSVGSRLGMRWLTPWIHHGLHPLNPLAWAIGLGALGLVFLALYVCLALIFRDGVERCAQTFERQPGQTILTAVLTALLAPVLLLLLVITLIGIAAVPLVVLALFCTSLFGKAGILAWLGHRVLGERAGATQRHPALAVLVGGLILLLLYFMPLLGLLLFQVLGLLGLGVAVYTLLRINRERHAGVPPPLFQGAPARAPMSNAAATAPAALPVTGPYAGFWVRIAALLLDTLLIGIVVHLLPGAGRLELLALAAYGAVMWKLRGTTIGGIVFDLHVVRLDGRPVDWTTAIVRSLGCFLSLAIAGLGFFWIAVDDTKQAWHDKFAGTVVVRVAKAPSLV